MGHRVTWGDKDDRTNSNVTGAFFFKFCLHSFTSLNAGLISFNHGWQIPYKCVCKFPRSYFKVRNQGSTYKRPTVSLDKVSVQDCKILKQH